MDHILKISLDNGREYYVLEEIAYKNYQYVFLICVNNAQDVMIQKYQMEKGIKFLEPINSDEEFDEIIKLFPESLLKEE